MGVGPEVRLGIGAGATVGEDVSAGIAVGTGVAVGVDISGVTGVGLFGSKVVPWPPQAIPTTINAMSIAQAT